MKETYKYVVIMVLLMLAIIALLACARYYENQTMALLTTASVLFGMGIFTVLKLMIVLFGGKHHGNKK